MNRKLINLMLWALLGLPFCGHALADAPQCGPLSKWTGNVCVGPQGKAYCPSDMTMNGNTCIAAASSSAIEAQPLDRRSLDTDHTRIIQMLTALTNQVTQQGEVINDLQQKLIAMQIVLNLTATSAHEAKAEASDIESSIASIQASNASLATNVSSLQANSTTLAGKVSAVQSQVSQVLNAQTAQQNAQSAQQAAITDMSKRLLYTCLVDLGMYSQLDPPQLDPKIACKSNYWPAGTWDFTTPFEAK